MFSEVMPSSRWADPNTADAVLVRRTPGWAEESVHDVNARLTTLVLGCIRTGNKLRVERRPAEEDVCDAARDVRTFLNRNDRVQVYVFENVGHRSCLPFR